MWLQWLPRRVYVQKHTRHCALWLYSLFFVVQLLWAVWSLVHNVAAVHALVDSLTARLDLLFTPTPTLTLTLTLALTLTLTLTRRASTCSSPSSRRACGPRCTPTYPNPTATAPEP